MPKLRHGRKHSSSADRSRKHRDRQTGAIRLADQAPAERYNHTPIVYTSDSVPRNIAAMARFATSSTVTVMSTDNALGGRHVYLEHALTKRSTFRAFQQSLAVLVRNTMSLPASTNVQWVVETFPDGTQIMSSWVLRYDGVGGWHTDVAPVTHTVRRTWTICVALKANKSHFEISNRSTNREGMRIWQYSDPVVIFQTHLLHRGNVAAGGSRIVLAAEFSLDQAMQDAIVQRNKGQN